MLFNYTAVDLDQPIDAIPGMEEFLRRRDLPSFCRSSDISEMSLQFIMAESQHNAKADAIIFNTFEELESPILHQMAKDFPKLYTIGPVQVQLRSRLSALETSSPQASNNGIWKEDRSCLNWLDNQPTKSVIYVSFGSVVVMTREQVMEFWHGLVNSGKRFLWVIRPDSVTGNNGEHSKVPAELMEATKERGYTSNHVPYHVAPSVWINSSPSIGMAGT